MAKLEQLYERGVNGKVTRVRGIDAPVEGVISVLSNRQPAVPPRSTSWAVSGAYRFAAKLQAGSRAQPKLDKKK